MAIVHLANPNHLYASALMEMPTHDGVSDAPGSSQFMYMAGCDIDLSNVLKVRPIYVLPDCSRSGSRGIARVMGSDDGE